MCYTSLCMPFLLCPTKHHLVCTCMLCWPLFLFIGETVLWRRYLASVERMRNFGSSAVSRYTCPGLPTKRKWPTPWSYFSFLGVIIISLVWIKGQFSPKLNTFSRVLVEEDYFFCYLQYQSFYSLMVSTHRPTYSCIILIGVLQCILKKGIVF